jgi:hypothetical protein
MLSPFLLAQIRLLQDMLPDMQISKMTLIESLF